MTKTQKADVYLDVLRYGAEEIDYLNTTIRDNRKKYGPSMPYILEGFEKTIHDKIKLIEENHTERAEIIKKVQNQQQRNVLVYYYIQGLTNQAIARMMYYTPAHISRIKKTALDAVADLLGYDDD